MVMVKILQFFTNFLIVFVDLLVILSNTFMEMGNEEMREWGDLILPRLVSIVRWDAFLLALRRPLYIHPNFQLMLFPSRQRVFALLASHCSLLCAGTFSTSVRRILSVSIDWFSFFWSLPHRSPIHRRRRRLVQPAWIFDFWIVLLVLVGRAVVVFAVDFFSFLLGFFVIFSSCISS